MRFRLLEASKYNSIPIPESVKKQIYKILDDTYTGKINYIVVDTSNRTSHAYYKLHDIVPTIIGSCHIKVEEYRNGKLVKYFFPIFKSAGFVPLHQNATSEYFDIDYKTVEDYRNQMLPKIMRLLKKNNIDYISVDHGFYIAPNTKFFSIVISFYLEATKDMNDKKEKLKQIVLPIIKRIEEVTKFNYYIDKWQPSGMYCMSFYTNPGYQLKQELRQQVKDMLKNEFNIIGARFTHINDNEKFLFDVHIPPTKELASLKNVHITDARPDVQPYKMTDVFADEEATDYYEHEYEQVPDRANVSDDDDWDEYSSGTSLQNGNISNDDDWDDYI